MNHLIICITITVIGLVSLLITIHAMDHSDKNNTIVACSGLAFLLLMICYVTYIKVNEPTLYYRQIQ